MIPGLRVSEVKEEMWDLEEWQPTGQGWTWVEVDLGKWHSEGRREVQDGAGLGVETQDHHPVVLRSSTFLSGRLSQPMRWACSDSFL